MNDLQDDLNQAKSTMLRLHAAFAGLAGTSDNSWSKQALQMRQQLERWEEKFGVEELEKAERERLGDNNSAQAGS